MYIGICITHGQSLFPKRIHNHDSEEAEGPCPRSVGGRSGILNRAGRA